MSSLGCRTSLRCVDERVPVRATYVNLYRWPESDAEFVKSVTGRGGGGGGGGRGVIRRSWSRSPAVVDSYSCRQMYLRSYTFSKEEKKKKKKKKKKESVPEKTRRCLVKLKKTALPSALVYHRRKSSDLIERSGGSRDRKNESAKPNRTKKDRCVVAVTKLREVSRSALYSVFWRLLSCTTNAGTTVCHPKE